MFEADLYTNRLVRTSAVIISYLHPYIRYICLHVLVQVSKNATQGLKKKKRSSETLPLKCSHFFKKTQTDNTQNIKNRHPYRFWNRYCRERAAEASITIKNRMTSCLHKQVELSSQHTRDRQPAVPNTLLSKEPGSSRETVILSEAGIELIKEVMKLIIPLFNQYMSPDLQKTGANRAPYF